MISESNWVVAASSRRAIRPSRQSDCSERTSSRSSTRDTITSSKVLQRAAHERVDMRVGNWRGARPGGLVRVRLADRGLNVLHRLPISSLRPGRDWRRSTPCGESDRDCSPMTKRHLGPDTMTVCPGQPGASVCHPGPWASSPRPPSPWRSRPFAAVRGSHFPATRRSGIPVAKGLGGRPTRSVGRRPTGPNTWGRTIPKGRKSHT